MYEKYNVIEMAPEAGSGGEYEVQVCNQNSTQTNMLKQSDSF